MGTEALCETMKPGREFLCVIARADPSLVFKALNKFPQHLFECGNAFEKGDGLGIEVRFSIPVDFP